MRDSLSDYALDWATASVVADGGPLPPFAVVEDADGTRHVQIFSNPDHAPALMAARAHIGAAEDAAAVAIGWDGRLQLNGIDCNAVFVEVAEVGASRSVILAQRYTERGRFRTRTEPIGGPLTVANGTLDITRLAYGTVVPEPAT